MPGRRGPLRATSSRPDGRPDPPAGLPDLRNRSDRPDRAAAV